MTDWVARGQEISDVDALREYVSDLRTALRYMDVGLERAVWGVLNSRDWLATPGHERPTHDDLMALLNSRDWLATPGRERPTHDDLMARLNMTVTPAKTTAREALYWQSLAVLFAALEAVDGAALAAWLADVNLQDPDKPA